MNIETVKALAKILNSSGLNKLELCEGDTKLSLEKAAPPPASSSFAASPKPERPAVKEPEKELGFNNITEIKSPVVGIFYASPSPDADPFVTIGTKVKKGDVLCVVEAMKLMNEITAERDGEIADICMKNGDLAEFGQVLFKLF